MVWLGTNSSGELGLGHTTSPVVLPTKLMGNLERPVFISSSTTAFRMKNGTWLGAGRNSNGELGLGYTTNPIVTPTLLPHLQDVVEILPMINSTIVKKEGGSGFYGWGANNVGQLALGNTNLATSPTKINSLGNATKVLK